MNTHKYDSDWYESLLDDVDGEFSKDFSGIQRSDIEDDFLLEIEAANEDVWEAIANNDELWEDANPEGFWVY